MKLSKLLLPVLALSAAAAFAQRGQAPLGPPRGGRGFAPPALDIVQETQQALNLSNDQVIRLRALLDNRVQSDQRAQDDIQAKLDAIAALQKKSANSNDVNKATQALRQAEQARQNVNEKFRTDFQALLTSEQKKTLDDLNNAAARVAALNRLGVLDNLPGAPPPPPPGPGPGPGPGPRGQRGFGGPGPIGFAPGPPANPVTAEKVALGRKLFFDKKLSADQSIACVTCHDPEHGFADSRKVAMGVKHAEGSRNSPALVNVGLSRSFFWDGRTPTLERQVLEPFLNPKELGLTEAELEQKTGLKQSEVAEALSSYVRTIRSTASRFDSFNAGQTDALNDIEKAGLDIFRGKGLCAGCHGGPNLTDDQFHNTGVAWRNGGFADEGRFAVTLNPQDHGAFKTPTLREIARTAPYMHDGSLATLEQVVDFYSDGGKSNPYLDPRVRSQRFSAGEKMALVAFLKTLSGRVVEGM